MTPSSFLTKTFDFNLGNLTFSPTYVIAGAIVFLLFLLVLTLAQVRRHLLNWSIKGGIFGISLGFLLALIFEGFLLIGGRTIITEFLGWKNAPKPIVNILDAGRAKLVKVLGVTDEIPVSSAKNYSSDEVLDAFQSLSPKDQDKVRGMVCEF
ncbi:hypothetical protein A3E15_01340 [Candidatus Woesebacteria bacterium RIFCSPHIGHO2_12_FULL_42_9]|uniref:Uncharacterized protein n=1 Tax=Candidatus Woesebacteria bacterium RIFCSPHIGHO2_12_FULL_42_9 TaxID=1802511 RepID=A0A1F8AS76_9BACT|nr:MAG: hypothetical protein A3E15_01340 [Candidatus Woesebacteria bacterium RIFCSPHIGHO2_12_FULL_42_9]